MNNRKKYIQRYYTPGRDESVQNPEIYTKFGK